MEEKRVTHYLLDTNMLKSLPFDKYDKDFTFIVNNKEYKTSRIIADILSPQICKYHLSDSTIDTFTINTEELTTQHDFSEILSLISFDPRELDDEELDYYRAIFLLLGNEHEYLKLYPKYSGEITLQNVFELIR